MAILNLLLLTIAGASTLIFSQNFILKYFRKNIFNFSQICKFGTPFAKQLRNARNRAEFVNFRRSPGIKTVGNGFMQKRKI